MQKTIARIVMILLLLGSAFGCRTDKPKPASPTASPSATNAPSVSPDTDASPMPSDEPVSAATYREFYVTFPSRGVDVHASVVLPPRAESSGAPASSPDASAMPDASASPDASMIPEGSASPDASLVPESSASPDVSAMPDNSASPDASLMPESSASPDTSMIPEGSASPAATEGVTPILQNTSEAGYPWVVFLHGHGGERNENGGFSEIAHTLASNGIASIRMDFAGSGESEEPFTENTLTSMYTDTLAAIDFIKATYPVDENAIGVFGFDMGGRVALHLIAQKLFDFRSAVLLAPANSNSDWITLFGGQEEWNRYKTQAELNNYTTFTTPFGQAQDLSIQWFSDLEMSDDPAAATDPSFRNRALIIYASNDTTVSPEVSRYVAEKLGAETLVLDSGGHSYGFYAENKELVQKIASAAAEFFLKTLRTAQR